MPQLTNAIKKYVASLAETKGRRKANAFIVEGTKCVTDTIDSFRLLGLYATAQWLDSHQDITAKIDPELITVANRGEIGAMSSMVLAPDVIAVYSLPQQEPFAPEKLKDKLVIALDRIQDPGNLGTIMRTADWMGIDTILASQDTVDCFNPKAIQATMGAISRVHIIYGDLPEMLHALDGMEIYGTFLDGENIYTAPLSDAGVIILGNEGQGIGEKTAACVTRKLLIPSYPPGRTTSESLNVATANAIALSQFIARKFNR